MTTNFEKPNAKLQVMLANQDLEDATKINQQRKFVAKMLLTNLKTSPDWMKLQTLRLLFLYKDIPEVLDAVKSLKETPGISEIFKSFLLKFLKGEMDVSDFIEQRKRLARLKAKVDSSRKESKLKSSINSLQTIPEQLNLVKMKSH